MLAVVVGACAVDAQDPDPTSTGTDGSGEMDVDAERTKMDGAGGRTDVCALAASLPDGDICRNVCDPGAMAAQLIAEGADTGNCYQLYCQLSETQHVLAGVCLAP